MIFSFSAIRTNLSLLPNHQPQIKAKNINKSLKQKLIKDLACFCRYLLCA